MGIRDSRTTHPRKQARRQRAYERWSLKPGRHEDGDYLNRKAQEKLALERAGCR